MQNKFGNRRLTSMVTKGMTKISSRDIENTKTRKNVYIWNTYLWNNPGMIRCDITSHSKMLEINTMSRNINNLYCFHTVTVVSHTKEHRRYLYLDMEQFPGYTENSSSVP